MAFPDRRTMNVLLTALLFAVVLAIGLHRPRGGRNLCVFDLIRISDQSNCVGVHIQQSNL